MYNYLLFYKKSMLIYVASYRISLQTQITMQNLSYQKDFLMIVIILDFWGFNLNTISLFTMFSLFSKNVWTFIKFKKHFEMHLLLYTFIFIMCYWRIIYLNLSLYEERLFRVPWNHPAVLKVIFVASINIYPLYWHSTVPACSLLFFASSDTNIKCLGVKSLLNFQNRRTQSLGN